MAEHALFPTAIVVDYHSNLSSHKMTIPAREWNPVSITGDAGSFESWNEDPIDAQAMVEAFITAAADLMTTGSVFDRFTIYTYAEPGSVGLPKAGGILDIAGTISTAPNWFAAVARTFTFYDTAFETVKIVLLDASSGNVFNKKTNSSLSEDEETFRDIFESEDWAWQSRTGFRPAVLRSLTTDLNDALRKQYGLG